MELDASLELAHLDWKSNALPTELIQLGDVAARLERVPPREGCIPKMLLRHIGQGFCIESRFSEPHRALTVCAHSLSLENKTLADMRRITQPAAE